MDVAIRALTFILILSLRQRATEHLPPLGVDQS